MSAFPRHTCAGDFALLSHQKQFNPEYSKRRAGAVSTLTGSKVKDGYAREMPKMRHRRIFANNLGDIVTCPVHFASGRLAVLITNYS
jgi:hypothetical protein